MSSMHVAYICENLMFPVPVLTACPIHLYSHVLPTLSILCVFVLPTLSILCVFVLPTLSILCVFVLSTLSILCVFVFDRCRNLPYTSLF